MKAQPLARASNVPGPVGIGERGEGVVEKRGVEGERGRGMGGGARRGQGKWREKGELKV